MQTNITRAISGYFLCAALLIASLSALQGCDRVSNLTENQRIERAKTFRDQGNRQGEVIELKNLLQKNPNHPEARWRLGEAYIELGYGDEAEKELVRARALGIDPEVIKVALGKALIDQGSFNKVLEQIEPGPKSSTANIAAIKTLRAEALINLRKYDAGCAMFTEAQTIDASHVPAYWGTARCAAGLGKPAEALAQYDAALKLDGKNTGTWRRRGDFFRDQKKYPEAEQAYSSGLGLHPEDLPTLFARAVNRLQLNDQKGVQADLDVVEKLHKGHPMGRHLKGVLLYKQGRYAEAKTTLERVLATNPSFGPSILWLGLTDFALKNWEQAAKGLRRYVEGVPNAFQVQALVALIDARQGGKQAAADTLAALGKLDVEDPQSLAMIGQTYMLIGDNEAGVRYLTKAVEKGPEVIDSRLNLATALLQKGDALGAVAQAELALKKDPRNSRAAMVLIATLLEAKKTDQAIQVATDLQKSRPDDPNPLQYRAAIKAEINDVEGAKADLEASLKLDPGNELASRALADLAIKRQDYAAARRYYQQARDKHGDTLQTLMAVYSLEIYANDLAAARAAVEKAAEKFPKVAAPSRIVASAYLKQQNPNKALDVSNMAATANPDDIELLQIRGRAFLQKADVGNALIAFQRLVRLRPNVAEAHVLLAQAQLGDKDTLAARKSLTQALKLENRHVLAKTMLAKQELASKKYDEALRLSLELQKDTPELLDGYFVQAGVLEAQNQKAEALAVLERAQKSYPTSELAVIELAQFHANAGARDKGIALVKSWLNEHSDNLTATAYVAESYMVLKQENEAVAAYEKLLVKLPGNAMVLNNMANLLAKSDPRRALGYAEQARKAASEDPSIADTYGWLLLKAGDKKQALSTLKGAFEAMPESPEVHYHYAAALAENGESAQAKRELEKLLRPERQFALRKEAERLLKTL